MNGIPGVGVACTRGRGVSPLFRAPQSAAGKEGDAVEFIEIEQQEYKPCDEFWKPVEGEILLGEIEGKYRMGPDAQGRTPAPVVKLDTGGVLVGVNWLAGLERTIPFEEIQIGGVLRLTYLKQLEGKKGRSGMKVYKVEIGNPGKAQE